MEIDVLIEKIKNGDEKAFEELLNRHKKMIYKIIYTLPYERSDFVVDEESLFQEGSIALYKAVFTYENNTNMCFTSYAYMVMRSRILTYIRDNCRYLNNEVFSIDNCDNIDYQISINNLFVSEDPIKYHQELEFENHLNSFINNLSNEDKQIFKMRSENLSYRQISERLHINTKRIDNRLRALRQKLRKYLSDVDKNV